jgi:CBS domain-containing protein
VIDYRWFVVLVLALWLTAIIYPLSAIKLESQRYMMRPVQSNFFVKANASLDEAKKLMRGNGIGVLGVIDENAVT